MEVQESPIQVIQTRFRTELVKTWPIQEGMKILEIGCGQGDTTAVLAERVGPSGHVMAVDIGPPGYGSPLTLAEATNLIKASEVGDRVSFHFDFDVMEPGDAIPIGGFDAIIMAHCTWYFDSLEQLQAAMAHIHRWAPILCLSEWDLQPRKLGQLGHLLAVLIQGQVEAFKNKSEANVRTPHSREILRALLARTGWHITLENEMDTTEMQDAEWEIRACLTNSLVEAESLPIPDKLMALLRAQVDVLRQLEADGRAHPSDRPVPLNAYSIVAER